MVVAEPEPTNPTDTPAPEPAPAKTFTADDLLAVIRRTCAYMDPEHAAAYRRLDASHIHTAVRFNARLLEAHKEYQRVYRITRRGRRKHATETYRWLDVVPREYAVIATAWSLLPTALLDVGNEHQDPTANAVADSVVG